MVLYFAYGSNLLLAQIRERTNNPTLYPKFIAYVQDHELIFPRESSKQKGGVASIEKKRRKKIWGAVFELNEDELKYIDKNEGYSQDRDKTSNAYNRVEIEVFDSEGKKHIVKTYIANKKGEFLPSKYYLDKIIKSAEECGLPKDYIDYLKSIKTKKE